jgi:hypothetical protein
MAPNPKYFSQQKTFPWFGSILPWSAALRERPSKSPQSSHLGIMVDLPRDTLVKVTGRTGGWLHVEVTYGSAQYKGYISQELVGRASASLSGYVHALQQEDWREAAKQLDCLRDEELLACLSVLTPSQLAYTTQGALLAMPLHRRVTGPIARMSRAAYDLGSRLAAAQKQLEAVEEQFGVDVIPREDWGALPPDKSKGWDEYPKNAPLPLDRIVVHHTADPLSQTVKQLESKERNAGYADMPYHFVITSDGKLYEGRSINIVGAHAGELKGNKDITKDPDYGAIGIVVTGDFESRLENAWSPDKPTKQQLGSLQRLINHLLHTYGIKTTNIIKHSQVKRSGRPKVCPGQYLSPHVDASRGVAQKALEELAAAGRALAALKKQAAQLK